MRHRERWRGYDRGERELKKVFAVLLPLAGLAAILVMWVGTASAVEEPPWANEDEDTTAVSGAIDYKDFNSLGNAITECPQAGLRNDQPKPLRQLARDSVEQMSDQGSNIRANQDYSCMPQDETSLDINPTNKRNIVGGANDYRLGWGTSGFYASTDNGRSWYDGITPFPSLPSGDNLDGGGDPAIVYDRDGIVYYAQINFNRTDDTSGVWVNRSTNGGFTWSRPCVAIRTAPAPSEQAACGGPGDPRQPGDGTVGFIQDNDTVLNGSVPSFDKEWITAGPRPAGVTAQCFTPLTHTPQACNPDQIGSDRLYVTYSLFSSAGSAQIFLSYSDDRAHSWSAPQFIAGGEAFCAPGGRAGNSCSDSQGSQPTVNPTTGQLWVGFLNGDTEDEDQYLVVTSKDGGQTFSPPSRVDTIYDVNEPRGVNGRADCVARGQGSTRAVPTNSCFRFDPIMNSIVADKRGGAFADDLYVVLADNRNGTIRDSNNDVFFYKSTDGGLTWIGPTRVNNDRSEAPTAANANGDPAFVRQGGRDCGRNNGTISGRQAGCAEHNFGADQFFPWVTIDTRGNLNVTFHDRRLDTDSPAGAGAWPTSKTEVGNYLVWYWGATCKITSTSTVSQATTGPVPAAASQCVAPEAIVNPSVATGFNPAPGLVPGQGQNSATLPFRNFQVSDTPSNFDYTFRAGLFAGDYSGNVTGPVNPLLNQKGDEAGIGNNDAYALWTDARNGRGSGAPTSFEAGRNPICEQSDVFFDSLQATGQDGNGRRNSDLTPWLVTPCPLAGQDRYREHGNGK
jgi:hypothetical protein